MSRQRLVSIAGGELSEESRRDVRDMIRGLKEDDS